MMHTPYQDTPTWRFADNSQLPKDDRFLSELREAFSTYGGSGYTQKEIEAKRKRNPNNTNPNWDGIVTAEF